MEQLIKTFITTGICNVVVLTSFEFCCLEGFNIIVSIVCERKCFRVDFNAINIHIFGAIMIFLPLTPIRALASLGPRIGVLRAEISLCPQK